MDVFSGLVISLYMFIFCEMTNSAFPFFFFCWGFHLVNLSKIFMSLEYPFFPSCLLFNIYLFIYGFFLLFCFRIQRLLFLYSQTYLFLYWFVFKHIGRHCVRHCGQNFTLIIWCIPPYELYQTRIIIIAPFYSEEIDSTNANLGTKSMQPDSLAVLTIYLLLLLLDFVFGVMFRNAFQLSK